MNTPMCMSAHAHLAHILDVESITLEGYGRKMGSPDAYDQLYCVCGSDGLMYCFESAQGGKTP